MRINAGARAWGITVMLGLATIAATPAGAAGYSGLTVFGDSLVDAGNLYALTGGAIPDAATGYKDGRFTNGYDYTDLLSRDLFGTVTTASRLGGSNYAYGNARAVADADIVPDLASQIASFSARTGGIADSNGLYVLTVGGNDIFAALRGTYDTAAYASADAYLHAAARTYAAGVKQLSDLGARDILLTNFAVPGPGLGLSLTANTYLTQELSALSLGTTQVDVVDLSGFLTAALTNPQSVGLPPLNPSVNCVAAGAQATGCAGYFQFDDVHPTAQVQQAFYDSVIRPTLGIAAVPETGTWLELVAGVSMIGFTLRRSRALSPRPARA
jgi:phospholipase/lecithinase/hemolysin